ncbi:major facilitator superfamily protein [Actinidia rufa]|uniref:Major facilitator superfamily protein n=1 Tax=Actinidia rufa TaxID=165716 RepID=A0A7J0FPF7_9ERIC|nr:major facilitator superfamily protein [Actinidia rufa]
MEMIKQAVYEYSLWANLGEKVALLRTHGSSCCMESSCAQVLLHGSFDHIVVVSAKLSGITWYNLSSVDIGLMVIQLATFLVDTVSGWHYMYGASTPLAVIIGIEMWWLPASPRLRGEAIGDSALEQVDEMLDELSYIGNDKEARNFGNGNPVYYDVSILQNAIMNDGAEIYCQGKNIMSPTEAQIKNTVEWLFALHGDSTCLSADMWLLQGEGGRGCLDSNPGPGAWECKSSPLRQTLLAESYRTVCPGEGLPPEFIQDVTFIAIDG